MEYILSRELITVALHTLNTGSVFHRKIKPFKYNNKLFVLIDCIMEENSKKVKTVKEIKAYEIKKITEEVENCTSLNIENKYQDLKNKIIRLFGNKYILIQPHTFKKEEKDNFKQTQIWA